MINLLSVSYFMSSSKVSILNSVNRVKMYILSLIYTQKKCPMCYLSKERMSFNNHLGCVPGKMLTIIDDIEQKKSI